MQIQIDNMTCGSCARHVTQAIKAVDAEAKVLIDVSARRATVETSATEQAVTSALAADGYEARVI
ncbi:heavy metal-associated domain-containing protein [Hyphomicrobium sp. D-2]|uniref:heavy-metal-associated domain-containing protein n=1 Tax=Hyphomicrobium sp. D-2 TaxID=3041621 RepID=UPI0024587817|nr:heavy metal-associated domain-containing protein [Hyphomicrobium sp. D-2]MDH4981831.1 heavy metal-associated domain-containing protein [Hyphomicrobium sp. D-2]